MYRRLIHSGGDAAVVKRVIELYEAEAMTLSSPLLLFPQRRNGETARDHYWRRTWPFGMYQTFLSGKFKYHAGEDFSLYGFDEYIYGAAGNPRWRPTVFAPCDMEIHAAEWGHNGGNHINAFLITPEVQEDVYAWFFHLGRLLVRPGDAVQRGEPISEMVCPSGGWGKWARGPHVHVHVSLEKNSVSTGINWTLFEDLGHPGLNDARKSWADSVVQFVKENGDRNLTTNIPKALRKRWMNLKPDKRSVAFKELGWR